MTLRFTILGCGSSGGIPRIGGDWGVCDPNNPKNNRQRCSLMVERIGPNGTTRVVIDTSPDFRAQMLQHDVKSLDAVWYTHDHADHTHGIDELRGFYLMQRKRVPVHADMRTLHVLKERFGYIFETQSGSDYPPVVDGHVLQHGVEVTAVGEGGAISATPFFLNHGNIDAFGFRIGNVVYSPDVNDIPVASLPFLDGLDIWIVDALRRTRHPSHFSLSETLDWIAKLKPVRSIITNMHNDLDYATLCEELKENIIPAFDGLNFAI